jgi:hypothetical protein
MMTREVRSTSQLSRVLPRTRFLDIWTLTMSSSTDLAKTGGGQHVTLLGPAESEYPLILCFHGSGDSCESWRPLANLLEPSYRVLLWDREDPNAPPDAVLDEMKAYLQKLRLPSPYVLIAHSYGGTFARLFLQRWPDDVAGMVLAETGQETALDPTMEQQQFRTQILGKKPLSVIRGNTLIGKWKQLEQARATSDPNDPTSQANLQAQRHFLGAVDKEDERLKRAQLALSSHGRYVHIQDCGHDVIDQKPGPVAEEVRWVMDNLYMGRDVGVEQGTPLVSSASWMKRTYGRLVGRSRAAS